MEQKLAICKTKHPQIVMCCGCLLSLGRKIMFCVNEKIDEKKDNIKYYYEISNNKWIKIIDSNNNTKTTLRLIDIFNLFF